MVCIVINYDNWTFLFEEGNQTVNVNFERNVLTRIFCNTLRELEKIDLENVWFQQNRVMGHIARTSMKVLRKMFSGRLISTRGDISWCACYSDLIPCVFFLWAYMKSEVYKRHTKILKALIKEIHTEIRRILQEMLKKVM